MKTLKKALSLLVAMTLLVACFACLGISVSAATKTDIVRDGLVVWYDASNNSNGIQEYEATVWKDLTGNGNHMPVKIDENNYWTDNAFHVTNNPTYFPDAVVDVINGEQYTFEMVLGEVDFTATNWITLMCSDNDEFSLFVRVPNGDDTDDNLEFKYNDKNQDRPKMDDGAALLDNSTLTITFDLSDPNYGICTVYVNGVATASGVPQHTNIADTLMWGHSSPQRAWGGDVYGFRFYDRCLSPEEVAENSSADERNYRNGNYFEPTVEYDGSNDGDLAGVDLSKYKNDVVVLDEFTDLVPAIGAVNAMRSNYDFTEINNAPYTFGDCPMIIQDKKVNPPEKTKGFIARTYFYFEMQYPRFRINSSMKKMMSVWDKQYPVNEWECKRAKRIEYFQKNPNIIVKTKCIEAGIWPQEVY